MTRLSCRLGKNRNALRPLSAFTKMRLRRKLQHGCLLSLGQAGEQHNLLIGEFQSIVVGHLFLVDLPEDRRLVMCRNSYGKPRFD